MVGILTMVGKPNHYVSNPIVIWQRRCLLPRHNGRSSPFCDGISRWDAWIIDIG